MPSYSYSIPIMNTTVNAQTRGEYLRLLIQAKAQRVLLAVCDLWDDEATVCKNVASLKENIAFFAQNGLEVGIWQGATIGHGVPLMHETDFTRKKSYAPLVNFNGEVITDTRCPLDCEFQQDLADYLVRLARETGAKLILLDDDFRIAMHGEVFCCACDAHLAKMSELCGEEITRKDLFALAFTGKQNKYRSAYLRAMGDSLYGLARKLRAAMDEFDPDVRLGLCSGFGVWNLDGTTAISLAKELAGGTKPFLRLCGAPYWAVIDCKNLPFVLETERMFRSLCRDGEAELLAEGDVYPRPSYTVGAAQLELFDAAMRASGFSAILKYMVDYTTSPYYDQGYFKHHCRNLPLHEAIGQAFEGKTPVGVEVFVSDDNMEHADYTLATPTYFTPSPATGAMLQNCAIPTFYGQGETVCVAVFGENARHVPLDKIKKGAILDGVAAAILTERGVDVGLADKGTMIDHTVGFMETADEATIGIHLGQGRFLCAPLSPAAKVVARDAVTPLAYHYENASGQRFTVFTFEVVSLAHKSGLLRGYAIEKILLDGISAINPQGLPAHCPAATELYTLCVRDEHALTVGLFNCYDDTVLDGVLALDRVYSGAKFIGCSGHLAGDRLHLCDLAPYQFAAIVLTE